MDSSRSVLPPSTADFTPQINKETFLQKIFSVHTLSAVFSVVPGFVQPKPPRVPHTTIHSYDCLISSIPAFRCFSADSKALGSSLPILLSTLYNSNFSNGSDEEIEEASLAAHSSLKIS